MAALLWKKERKKNAWKKNNKMALVEYVSVKDFCEKQT